MRSSILVQNLKCGGCAHTITAKLEELDLISGLNVNVEESKVTFNCNNEIDVLRIKEKLMNLGYPPIDESNSFTTKAKSFVSTATGKLLK